VKSIVVLRGWMEMSVRLPMTVAACVENVRSARKDAETRRHGDGTEWR
jgi:hypothetical protein